MGPQAPTVLLQLPGAAELSEGQLSELMHLALQYGQHGVCGQAVDEACKGTFAEAMNPAGDT